MFHVIYFAIYDLVSLLIWLQSPDKKDLVIDPELTKPLDRVAGVAFLKVSLAFELTVCES